MFALPGIIGLMAFIYVRPHELLGIELLTKIPFLNLFCALALFGLIIDLKLRLVKPIPTPQFWWVCIFFGWVIINIAIKVPAPMLIQQTIRVLVAFLLFVVIAQSVQTLRVLQLLMVVVLLFSGFLTFVGIYQGLSPFGCAVAGRDDPGKTKPDGRPCTEAIDCYGPSAEPGAVYFCERVGLFETTSIEGRVRYIGVLQDPNELAVAMGAGLALLIGFASRRPSLARTLVSVIFGAAVLLGLILTKSRGGQLVFICVLGVYFVKRYGMKGLALGAFLAIPLLLVGGRGGSGASESANQRLEAWAHGIQMLKGSPVMGVGHDQFAEIHVRTAHNSYVLAFAELGFVGFVFWSIVIYVSVKLLWVFLRDFKDVRQARVARTTALSLLAAMAGILVGITFLSFSYHYVLWIYLGLCGAFFSGVRSHVPEWKVTFGWKDFGIIVASDLAYIALIMVYLRYKHML